MMNETQNTLMVDRLYSDIKERIIRGDLKPDEKLSVRKLCEYYGASDTPMKQALNRLVMDRLVDALPRRGMRVKVITKDDIHEAIEARMMIELFAAPYAIRKSESDGSIVRMLKENLEKNEELLRLLDDMSQYNEKNMEELRISQDFHRIIVSCIGNSVIMDAYQNILNHQYVYFQHEKDKRQEAAASIEEHREILCCLQEKDEEGLKKAIVNHLKIREDDVSSIV